MKLNAELVAERFGCTVEQAQAQYAKNAAALDALAVKAGAGVYRHKTAAQWRADAARFRALAGE